MEITIIVVALIALLGFRRWLKHQCEAMNHRERFKAIEKGVELLPLEQETTRCN